MTLSITTFRIITFRAMTLIIVLHYIAECSDYLNVMLSVVVLSAVMLCVAITKNVLLRVVVLNVVALYIEH
jgi:hypothetical protein